MPGKQYHILFIPTGEVLHMWNNRTYVPIKCNQAKAGKIIKDYRLYLCKMLIFLPSDFNNDFSTALFAAQTRKSINVKKGGQLPAAFFTLVSEDENG